MPKLVPDLVNDQAEDAHENNVPVVVDDVCHSCRGRPIDADFGPQAESGQVWSPTQLYSVVFSQSRIDVKKCVFNKCIIKVCVSCY